MTAARIDLAGLLLDVERAVGPTLRQVEWAEEEIRRVQHGNPGHADQLYHAFPLLQPTSDLMATEMVYRSHCRELLDRVVAGDDTRPPTHAEVAIVCSRTSLLAPLTTAGVTVYMRAWQRAFPDHADVLGTGEAHYEYIAGGHADELERGLRRRLTVAGRRLQEVACVGRHHGVPAPGCLYLAPPEQLALGVDRPGEEAAATRGDQTTAA